MVNASHLIKQLIIIPTGYDLAHTIGGIELTSVCKHGHGKAWRHPYRVLDVKPHAVKLEVPHDGSVPGVLAWQSLRKCSLAAPHFHSPDMPIPEVDDAGLPLADDSDPDQDGQGSKGDEEEPSNEGNPLPANDRYEIDRIVSAEPSGPGWSVYVKWKGYNEVGREPMSKILSSSGHHPEIVSEIKRCQEDYYLQNPQAAPGNKDELPGDDSGLPEESGLPETDNSGFMDNLRRGIDKQFREQSVARPEPTRVQPHRVKKTTPYVFAVYASDGPDSYETARQFYAELAHESGYRLRALKCFAPEILGVPSEDHP